MLVDIPIEHFAAGNGSTHGKEALGVVPIVDGIEEGRAAANGYDKKSHGKAEQKQPPQFASLIGFAEKNEIQARYLAIQPVYYITIFPQLQLCRKKVKNCSGFNDWLHSAHKITLMRMSVCGILHAGISFVNVLGIITISHGFSSSCFLLPLCFIIIT